MSEVDDFLSSYDSSKAGSAAGITQKQPVSGQTKKDSEVDELLAAAPAQDKGVLGHAKDLGLSLAKGVVAVPEAVVGIADIATGGRVGKFLENENGAIGFRPKQAKEFLSDFHTEGAKDQQRQFQQTDGIADKLGVALSNPSMIANTVAESVPSMLGGAVIGRGVAAAAPRLIGAGAASAIGEGAVMAGSAAEQIRQQTKDGLLTPEQSSLAAGTGVVGAGFGFLGNRVAQRLGIGDIDTMAVQGAKALTQPVEGTVAGTAQKGVTRQAIEGAIAEGLLEELPQSVSETLMQNIALDKPWNEGLDEAIVLGTLSGMAMGGGAAGARGVMSRRHPRQDLAAEQEPAESGGMALAPLDQAPAQQNDDGLEPFPGGTSAIQRAFDARDPHSRPPLAVLPPAPTDGIDFTPSDMAPIKPSEAMGLNPNAGMLSSAAVAAVDGGASVEVAAQAAAKAAAEASAKAPKGKEDSKAQAAPNLDVETGEVLSQPASDIGARSYEELRTQFQTAQNKEVRLAIAAELQRRRTEQTATSGAQINGTQANQAQQTSPQPAPAGAAQTAAAGIADAAASQNTGTQGPTTPGAQGTPEAGGTITTKGGKPFASKIAAGREMNKRGLSATHEVIPAATVQAGATGYIVRKKELSNGQAVDVRPGVAGSVQSGRIDATGSVDAGLGRGSEPGSAAAVSQPAVAGSLDPDGDGAGVGRVDALNAAASEAATSPVNSLPEPTQAQKDAGNYKKGHVKINGHDISIENPAGTKRSPKWPALKNHYGYIKGSVGADKDHVDLFMTDLAHEAGLPVFVVDQNNRDGSFDEHKVIMGAATEQEARDTYLSNYSKGWTGLGSITQMTQDEFKAWVRDPAKTKKPAAPAIKEQPNAQATDTAATDAPAVPDDNAAPAIDERVAADGGTNAAKATEVAGTGKKPRGILAKKAAADKAREDAKQAAASKEQSEATEFISAPGGGIDFGEITPDMAKAMKRQAGKIRLERGDDSYGEQHIERRHGDDIRAMGFDNVAAFVADIAKNIDQIWKPETTAQLVAIHQVGNDRVMFVELRPARDGAGDYYTVRSAFPARQGFVKNKGWKMLWEGRAQPSTDSSSSAPFAEPSSDSTGKTGTIPSGSKSLPQGGESVPAVASGANPFAVSPPNAGEAVTMTSGQSSDSNVSEKAPEGKKELRGILAKKAKTKKKAATQTPSEPVQDETDQGIALYSRKGGRDAYTQDMFGESLPAAARGDNAADAGRGADQSIDVDTADAVPAGSRFATRTSLVRENTRKLGIARISSVDDAAQAMSYLGRGAVERLDGLVTDKDGKPLAIVGAFKGALAQAAVYPSTVIGEAFRIKGAANIWFAHNHPSGKPDLSAADHNLYRTLKESFQGSGIAPRGLFAIAGNTNESREWEFTDGIDRMAGDTEASTSTVSVPVVERQYTQDGKLADAISSPAAAKSVAMELANGESGILLLDVRNRPLAFVPIDVAMPLREGGRMDALYRAISMANSGASMIVNNGSLDGPGIRNLGALLNSIDSRLLDVFEVTGSRVESWAEQGKTLAASAFYARGGMFSLGMDAADVRTDIASLTAKWNNAPSIQVVQSVEDLPFAAPSDARGVYARGKAWLVADNMQSPADAQFVLFHEVLGHAGLRGLFGDRLTGQLGVIALANQNIRTAAAKWRAANADLRGKRSDQAWQAISIEEAMADLAGEGRKFQGMDRLLAVIQSALRAIGLADVASWLEQRTDAEALRMLANARRHIEQGNEAHAFTGREAAAYALGGERSSGDGANQDARFSRASVDGVAQRLGDAIKSASIQDIKNAAGHKKADWLGLGLQALGRRQLVDIYGDMLPLEEYNRLAAQMEADKNEVGANADTLATRWGKLPDERQLAELMHDATLAQIDPDKEYIDGDDKVQHSLLRARFGKLSNEAQKVYRDARGAYQDHHAKVRQAIKERIERSELRGPRKAELLKQMDDEFFAAIKGVYFPLARFGQYVVTVKAADGKVESVGRAETMAEAQALRASMLKAFTKDKGYTVSRAMLSKEFVASRDSVGRGFMTELYDVLDSQDMDAVQRAELEDTLGQLYLSSLPDLSWAKHGIHRKGTPGFSQDARRAYAQNMFHGARYLAKLRYSDLMQDELTDMQKHVDEQRDAEDFDQPTAQRVVDEFNKRHESLMNPKGNPISTALTSFGFIFHMGLSPASAIVNLSQTALVAYPVMGAKWGFNKSAAALMRASQQAMQGKNDITGALSVDERRAYDEAVRAGTIDVTMAHDLAGIAQGEDAGVMWKMRPVMKAASFLFHHAERFNRQVTFIAAYRLARDAGQNHAGAFEQATKATYDGHFDYSSGNRPRIMQGNVAKVLLLFKQYGQNMVYTISRNAYQSMKGATPQERKQARKTLSGLLVAHGLAAGVMGLPMVTTLLAMASMVGGDDDEPWDAKVALQNMLADTFGQKPAEVFAHGLSRLTPWDISGRVGLDRLILPDVQEGLEGQRLAESAMAAALGPVAGIGVNVLKGMQDIGSGHVGRGLESMMPSVLRSPIKALRYANEGAQDRSGISIMDEVNPAAVIGQALGFSPSEVRNATEGKSAIRAQDTALRERRQQLLTRAAMASMASDAEGLAEAREEITRFNEKNPGRRINPNHIMASVRNRKKRVDQAQDGVYLSRNRQDAREAGRFAFPE